MSVTVTTKDELEKAITEKKEEIMVVGELAKKIKKANIAKKIAKGVGAAGCAAINANPIKELASNKAETHIYQVAISHDVEVLKCGGLV